MPLNNPIPDELTPSGVTLQTLTTLSELQALAPEWRALWLSDPKATPFQSPEWLIPWWEHVGEGDLHCLTARDAAGHLLALLPLYIYPQPATGERHLLLLGAGTSDYLDGVFDPDHPGVLAAVLLFHLTSEQKNWNRAFLSQLRLGSPLLFAAQHVWRRYEADPCFAFTVTSKQDLRSKLRSNINRYTRRAQGEGALQFRVAEAPAEASTMLEELISLHTKRWRGRGQVGVLSSPRVQAHHRAAVPLLQAAGLLHMFQLLLNGRPIALLYSLPHCSGQEPVGSDTLLLYLIGFDPEYAELSPGTLLLSEVYDFCIDKRISNVDLLRGGEAYKQLWSAQSHPTFGLEASP